MSIKRTKLKNSDGQNLSPNKKGKKSKTRLVNSNSQIESFKLMKSDEQTPPQDQDNNFDNDEKISKTKKSSNTKGKKRPLQHTDVSSNEKVDWKKLKSEKKELKIKRKQKQSKESGNETYDLGIQAKKIWEEIRREDCEDKRKVQLCKELYGMIKGKAKGLIYAHDTVRVIETLIAVGSEVYRTALYEELKDELHNLAKNKYSRFFVLKLLRYGPREQKNAIIDSFKGHVVEFMKHKVACDVVELAYNDFANSKQRSSMIQEFFGPQFRLFKEDDVLSLDDALGKYPEKRDIILKDLNNSLQPILDKGVFTNTMIHTLIKQYLTSCNSIDKSSFIESLREHLLPIIHTRDGARVAMSCIWHGSNKDRKTILKTFKSHFLKIATEEQSFMVLLAAFDCLDDTVFLKKAVISELMSDLKYMMASDSGRKVLKYLVAPRSKIFFHPTVLKVLEMGDINKISKKDTEVRKKEIFAAISEPILTLIEENIDEWALDSHFTLFVGAALQNLSGPVVEEILTSLAKICSEPYVPGVDDHMLEKSHTIGLIRYVIKQDKHRASTGEPIFCEILLKEASTEFPGWTLTNRGCFLLVNMLETEIKVVVEHVMNVIKPLKNKLNKQEFTGAKILLAKIK